MAKSLNPSYTPIASWVFQSMLGFSLPAFGIIPGMNYSKQSNSYNNNNMVLAY